MSEERTEEDTAFDADQLAALARPSLPPAPDDDDDDDDGPLDLKALTASMAPPAPGDEPEDDDDDESRVSMASVAPATSGEAKSSAEKSDAPKKAESKAKTTEADSGEKKAVAPVAATAADEEPSSGGSGKMLIGLIALLGIGAVVFALTQNTEPEEQAALYPPAATSPDEVDSHEEPLEEAEETVPAAGDVEEEVADEVVPSEEGEAEGAEGAEGLAAATDEAAVNTDPATRPDRRRRRAAVGSTDTEAATMEDTSMDVVAEAPSMEAEPTMEPAEATMEAGTSSMDDMDDLLTRALGGTPTEGGTMTAAPMEVAMEDRSALPETPSRAAVTRALGGLMGRMRRCAGDQVGMATARIRVNNDGQVVSANIGGSPFGGTPQGSCMEGVVRTARFPRFQRTHFDVTYPFSIRPIN